MAEYTARRVSMRLLGPGGAPLLRAAAAATLASLEDPSRRAFAREDHPTIWAFAPIAFEEGEGGLYSAVLVPNDAVEEGSVYRVRIQGEGGRVQELLIRMPDRDVDAEAFDSIIVGG